MGLTVRMEDLTTEEFNGLKILRQERAKRQTMQSAHARGMDENRARAAERANKNTF